MKQNIKVPKKRGRKPKTVPTVYKSQNEDIKTNHNVILHLNILNNETESPNPTEPNKVYHGFNNETNKQYLNEINDIIEQRQSLNNNGILLQEYNQFGYHKYPLYTNTHWNIYIIKWNPNSKTPIHNHDEQGCLMKILDGSFTEYKYKYILSRFFPQTQLIEIEKYGPYYDKDLNNSFIVDYFHSIQNDSKTEGFSLHIYPNNNFKPNVIE